MTNPEVVADSRVVKPGQNGAATDCRASCGSVQDALQKLPSVGSRALVNVGKAFWVGSVKFVGTTSFASGIWAGIELDTPEGKNDGIVQGVKYFDCQPKHGLFVRPKNVKPFSINYIMAETPDEVLKSHAFKGWGLQREVARAQREALVQLREAIEEKDIGSLRSLVDRATELEFPEKDLEAAKHLIDFMEMDEMEAPISCAEDCMDDRAEGVVLGEEQPREDLELYTTAYMSMSDWGNTPNKWAAATAAPAARASRSLASWKSLPVELRTLTARNASTVVEGLSVLQEVGLDHVAKVQELRNVLAECEAAAGQQRRRRELLDGLTTEYMAMCAWAWSPSAWHASTRGASLTKVQATPNGDSLPAPEEPAASNDAPPEAAPVDVGVAKRKAQRLLARLKKLCQARREDRPQQERRIPKDSHLQDQMRTWFGAMSDADNALRAAGDANQQEVKGAQSGSLSAMFHVVAGQPTDTATTNESKGDVVDPRRNLPSELQSLAGSRIVVLRKCFSLLLSLGVSKVFKIEDMLGQLTACASLVRTVCGSERWTHYTLSRTGLGSKPVEQSANLFFSWQQHADGTTNHRLPTLAIRCGSARKSRTSSIPEVYKRMSFPKDRSVVTLHIGGAGCGIGAAFWELLAHEHGIGQDRRARGNSFGSTAVHFCEGADGCFAPRGVLVDTDAGALAHLRKNPFAPIDIIEGSSGMDGNWAKSFYGSGEDMISRVREQIRQQAERADSMRCIMLSHAAHGGTGGGLVSRALCSHLSSAYRKTPVWNFSLVPPAGKISCVESYNISLTMQYLLEHSGICTLFDNDTLHGVCKRSDSLAIENPSFGDYNSLIARVMAGCTSPLRVGTFVSASEGSHIVDPLKLLTNMVPYPRTHFTLPAFAPLQSPMHAKMKLQSDRSVLGQCFEGAKLCSTNATSGSLLCGAFFCRSVPHFDAVDRAQEWLRSRDTKVVDWAPFPCLISSHRDPLPKGGNEVVGLFNTSAVGGLFESWRQQAAGYLQTEELVDMYTNAGLDRAELDGANDSLASLVRDYDEVAVETACDGSGCEEEG
eukprot:TRINITY_DN21514_c0_g3_i1.p1 TRINITY_DN21514_c0_g3~~TRINITY_DN21514_c0_g3_i1.p1  ORF type:complete len:1052 (+),score=160.57 TRINITY_DN21514_c0_g3_i1:77-3232(+)